MEPVIGRPIGRPTISVAQTSAVQSARQEILDQVNYILSFHTISSNTDEPDGRIRFVLDENGDVDIDGQHT